MIQILREYPILDEDLFSGVHAFVINGIRSIASFHGRVIDNRNQFIANLLAHFAIQT